MKTEEIIERLRHPQKYIKKTKGSQAQKPAEELATEKDLQERNNLIALGILAGVFIIITVTWLFVLNAKNRAENVSEAIDPAQVQGLLYEADFNPSKDITYVQITEGSDRNVAVDSLGTTLPIISRYNYQAITPKNYAIIGMAPWALTENFSANLQDPEIIRYLLNRKEVGEAFITREDVAPLLADPQLLASFVQDNKMLDSFFSKDPVAQVLTNEAMVRAVGGSRFMSYLLTSKAVKYFRDRPQEAVKLISASPTLNALRQNPSVRKAVEENYYLKSIAPQLLGPAPRGYAPATAPAKK